MNYKEQFDILTLGRSLLIIDEVDKLKLSSIKLNENNAGLKKFNKKIALGDVVVVSGSNGSGKTRFLKLLENYIISLRKGEENTTFDMEMCNNGVNETVGIQNIDKIEIVNYSHFDALLQSPKAFTPYVISKAKDLLKTCNYEETALNSLLLLEDMASGYSEEFTDGREFERFAQTIEKQFNIKINKDANDNHLKIFDLDVEEAALSPGQQYLIRIAVACYCNEDNDKIIFLLDEPELHLHPQALIMLIKVLRDKFPQTQFWISTHSLALISYLTVVEKGTTVLYVENGQVEILRSNSSKLLSGLIGTEENLFAIQQLMVLPDKYACNIFAAQCYDKPDTLGAVGEDPQTDIIATMFKPNDIVVDFGVGKGRLIEELAMRWDIVSKIQYYAYDAYPDDAEECKNVMKTFGLSENNYFGNEELLVKTVDGKADYVLMVNVLHEISPKKWLDLFKTISLLLKEEGKLVIVEREELTIGERPYENGFLMITQDGATKLFGSENYKYLTHDKKKYIVKYIVDKTGLDVTNEKILNSVEQIKNNAYEQVKALKTMNEEVDYMERYRLGIKLAFHLQQYANASLLCEELQLN